MFARQILLKKKIRTTLLTFLSFSSECTTRNTAYFMAKG